MVSATDLKIYKTTNNLGGAITGTQIPTATPNNLFGVVPRNEQVVGEDYYACVFIKNTHGTEAMDNFKLWLSDKSFPHDTEIKWGFEPQTATATGYRWSPSQTLNGSGGGVVSIADDPVYDLNNFTVACWFKTTDHNVPPEGEGFMVCKGGWLSNDPNKQLNYGLWHSDADHLRGGFEEVDGTDHIATSGTLINDGTWRHGLVRYDGTTVELWMNGTLRNSATTSTTPATSTNPLVIGDNSFSTTHLYYTGELDEVYVWNRAVTDDEIAALYTDNIANSTGLVYSNHFGTDDSVVVAQTIADKYTSPNDVEWLELSSAPTLSNVGQVKAGNYFPIWVWYHVNANAVSRSDDNETFSVLFDIPPGGTGTGGTGGSGGGGGGNPPPTTTDWKIAVAGDWGCEPTTDDVIQLIQTNNYDFVVGVGDNAYESAGCWTGKFNPLKPAFNSAYGNHEYSQTGGISPYKTFFGHSLTYFTFKFQNVFFLILDDNDFESGSAPSDSVGSTQYNFIKSELERVKNDGTITWRVAVTHHPWFGSGADHPANEGGQVNAYHSLFVNNGVNFVCVGHNHNWQRSHQVAYNSSSPLNPTVVASSSPYSRTAAGLMSIVSGTGGHDSGSGLYGTSNDAAFWAYRNRTHNGVWEMVATNSGQTLTCSFVDRDGAKFDTFVINA